MREDKSDAGPHGVYADWLQAQGSPVGEWVALAAALEAGEDARTQGRLAALATELALPTDKFATWGTQHGFWKWLRVENDEDWMTPDFDAAELAQKLFATPLCAALDELRLGILRWDHNSEDVPAVLGVAAQYAWATALRRLHLGDVDDNIDMAHHVIGDVGEAISKFPALRWLKLHSGSQEWRGVGETFGLSGLALPALETLVIETCAMTKQRLADVFAAKLPALTTLELWFGSTDYDSDVVERDLAPLLDGTVFPAITHLGLRNQAFGADLIDRLAKSPLAPRLVTLDLSMSTLDDDAIDNLATIADRFPALRTLDVDDNFVTAAALRGLEEAFAHANVIGERQDKLQDAEDGERFVSVHE